MRDPVCMGQGLSVLNFLTSPREGASELPYQFSQIWGRRGGGKGKTGKVSEIKHDKWNQTLYYNGGKELHV